MKISSPILAFTLASSGIHAGMFIMTNSIDMTLSGSTGSVISVKIEQITTPATLSKKIKKNEPLPQHVINHSSVTSKNLAAVTDSNSDIKSDDEKPAKNEQNQLTSVTNNKNAQAKAQVISIIYDELINHFNYPRLAQQRNWQGKVLLTFRVSTQGQIENIKINHSSGFDILDQAAIGALKKIGHLPQLASRLNTGMEIQLPVIYQLTEG